MSPATKTSSDFAHLFELFEKLASRRSRAEEAGEQQQLSGMTMEMNRDTDSDTHTLSIPTDLQPVFRNLATLVTPRTRTSIAQRGSRNGGKTLAFRSSSSASASASASSAASVIETETETDKESLAKFPMKGGKEYRFKFKMMLHKLYELDEWGKKVKEVLERSQKEFKSLDERENETESRYGSSENHREATTTITMTTTRTTKIRQDRRRREVNEGLASPSKVYFGGGVEAGITTPPAKRTGRPRSHTVGSPGVKGREPAHRSAGNGVAPALRTVAASPRDEERAVKKRCVGRRKSISGMNAGEKAWFYDAAIASSEINERLCTFDTPVSAPLSRYGALQPDGRRRVPPPRPRVSSVASAAIEERQQVYENTIKKRRATGVAVVKRS
ncbi:hypothetical protein GYMLUDRAFT_42393 [Collybiopsis luxurians FD-317 M1]|uniref:Uncharacterized protein n=1 Tax=Collybiopsis luxurians FD-317 M1 TaxID=944289 RepID=A0A0D0CRV4_9AGAR|nr:hypothetical protein GYMLUDRAFT_42393 [Collybiopsis luxurians FD-317 M1]